MFNKRRTLLCLGLFAFVLGQSHGDAHAEAPREFHVYLGFDAAGSRTGEMLRKNMRWISAMKPAVQTLLDRGYNVCFDSQDRAPEKIVADGKVAGLFSVSHGAESGAALYCRMSKHWGPASAAEAVAKRPAGAPLDLLVMAMCYGTAQEDGFRRAFNAKSFHCVGPKEPPRPIHPATIESWVDKRLLSAVKALPKVSNGNPELRMMGCYAPTYDRQQVARHGLGKLLEVYEQKQCGLSFPRFPEN